ncbi:MAG: RAD55 family ATPase [Syntrophaceticus sp.]
MITRGFFGVDGLDCAIPQGMEYGSQILVHGDTGVGKTVLAGEFLKEGLVCGDTCIYVACDEPPAVMRGHLRDYKIGVRAYEETGRLFLVDAYEEEESKERHFIATQFSLEKYVVLERNLLQQFTGQRVRLVVDSLSTLLIPFEQEDVLEFHRNRLKFLRRKGILAMDIFVDGVLDQRVMTIIGHFYNVSVRMKFGGPKARPERMIQVGKVKSGKFDAVPRRFGISPVFGIVFAPDVEV